MVVEGPTIAINNRMFCMFDLLTLVFIALPNPYSSSGVDGGPALCGGGGGGLLRDGGGGGPGEHFRKTANKQRNT